MSAPTLCSTCEALCCSSFLACGRLAVTSETFLPCLLERWSKIGADPGARKSARNSWEDVRRDVLRNLGWLLNTEAPRMLAGQEIPAAVRESTLCFGIPAFSGKVQSVLSSSDICQEIAQCIAAFEPRIVASSIDVQLFDEGDRHAFNRLRFTIHGLLHANPDPIEFLAHTELDLESGTASVTN